jgi:hypothetical protein
VDALERLSCIGTCLTLMYQDMPDSGGGRGLCLGVSLLVAPGGVQVEFSDEFAAV